jgi:hypothetical protein
MWFTFFPRFNWQNVNFTRGKKMDRRAIDSHGVKKNSNGRLKKCQTNTSIQRNDC